VPVANCTAHKEIIKFTGSSAILVHGTALCLPPPGRNGSIPGSIPRAVAFWRALSESIRRPPAIIHDAAKARDENPARCGSRALHGVPRNTISAATRHAWTVQGRPVNSNPTDELKLALSVQIFYTTMVPDYYRAFQRSASAC
jgi:hypothetical protein